MNDPLSGERLSAAETRAFEQDGVVAFAAQSMEQPETADSAADHEDVQFHAPVVHVRDNPSKVLLTAAILA